MTDVVMPRLSDTMEEGTVLRWLKHDGEHVSRGEDLVEIETDKASMTYESDREGTLQTIAREGDTLAVGELIARIGAAAGGEAPPTGDGAPPARVAEPTVERERPAPPPMRDEGERVKASPLARRIAHEAGIELHDLSGSGPGGRIVKADVETAVRRLAQAPIPGDSVPAVPTVAPAIPTTAVPTVAEVASAKGETTTVELSRTQRTIARRMAESKATIPDFTLAVDVDMERCAELRAELKRLSHPSAGTGGADQDGTAVPTYNDMIVKACALALREHPRANGSYRDGRFELHSRVNIGVAVAVDSGEPTSGALVVPTVFDADSKALGEIARETRALAERVRAGTITPPELSGATFSVSNLGMYGIAEFTAIVNPPQAAILAVGAVQRRAVMRTAGAGAGSQAGGGGGGGGGNGEMVVRHTMRVTLTCDHRILYGADAALFLARIRELLEEPAALTL